MWAEAAQVIGGQFAPEYLSIPHSELVPVIRSESRDVYKIRAEESLNTVS